MDGFHLADAELDRAGYRDRRGAPEMFDADGYVALLARIRAGEPVVYRLRFPPRARTAGACRCSAANLPMRRTSGHWGSDQRNAQVIESSRARADFPLWIEG